MLVDALRSFRRSFSLPARPRRSPHNRPECAAERLEDRTVPSAVTFFRKFEGIDWASAGAGGVGSQWNDGGSATLTVGGVQGEIVAAYLYWRGVDLLARGGDGVYDNAVATFNGVAVAGASLGTGGTGTWGAGSSQAFRADVTHLVRSGLSTYTVAGLAAKAGHSADGVSLVVVYQDGVRTNDRDLHVLDGNAVNVGPNADGPWDVRLDGLAYRAGDVRAELHVADGQSSTDAAVRFASAAGGSPVDLPDRVGRLDGSSVPNLGRSRAINGSLWDVHRFDVTPAFGGPGTHSFTLTQGTASSDSLSLVLLLVDTAARPANEPPVAHDVSLTVDEDVTLTGSVDARDPQGDATLTYSIVIGPSAGGVSLDPATGRFVYMPPRDFFGTVSFVYGASDGEFAASAVVTITVAPVNDLPVALPQSFSGVEDAPLGGRIAAFDVDGDALSFLLLDGPAHGTLVLAADGTYVFTPGRDWHGDDTFRVAVTDGRSDPVTVLVSLHVASVNDPPVVTAGEFRIAVGSAAGAVVGKVSATDVDGDPLAYAIVGGNTGGAFAIDPNTGLVTVADRRALAGRTGQTFSLIIQVADGRGGVASVVIKVQIVPAAVRFGVGAPGSQGVVDLKGLRWQPFVIYSTEAFDARQIDVGSLTFGRTGSERSFLLGRGKSHPVAYVDVNGDGRKDLVLLFDARATGLGAGDTSATLKGRLKDGTDFAGTAPVAVRAKPEPKAKAGGNGRR